eukprot:2305939-Amphidinium_carterae.2
MAMAKAKGLELDRDAPHKEVPLQGKRGSLLDHNTCAAAMAFKTPSIKTMNWRNATLMAEYRYGQIPPGILPAAARQGHDLRSSALPAH